MRNSACRTYNYGGANIDTVQEHTLEVGQEFFDFIKLGKEMKRTHAEVVMVIPRPDGQVLLMTKSFYPQSVYRLPSGGIHIDESAEDGLRRELMEETCLDLPVDKFLGELNYLFRCGNQAATFASYIYLMEPTSEEPNCADADEQITDFRYVPISDLPSIANHLRSLPGKWADWGRFRAIAHDFVAENCRIQEAKP
ncbi:MAG: NUDIX hydrolase [Armatimonadota bacterium]|nr:NUDIX hydrolase [Armatimonadota bacterium]